MSLRLISRSPDLKKLQDEGYDLEIRANYLLVKDVPYVNFKREVKRGILISELTLAGDITAAPSTHVAMFAGEFPCDKNGAALTKISHSGGQQLAENLASDHSFSSKPVGGGAYRDYHHKMTAYVAILLSHAQAIDPQASAQTCPPIPTEDDESVFNYRDTASSRAGINLASKKLAAPRVAIVGIGGTGSYVLDLLAKTPIEEIHLFDGDDFLSHNAFRAPGAASLEELRTKPKKAAYFKNAYANMRRGIFDHCYHVDGSNVAELREMSFVFLCLDASAAKKAIVESLEGFGIPFIDVGMGLELVDQSLRGAMRVTTSTPGKRDHFRIRAPLAGADANEDYNSNIQVADLNALNATLAVIKWKKLCGFYLDFEREFNTTYALDGNALISDDQE